MEPAQTSAPESRVAPSLMANLRSPAGQLALTLAVTLAGALAGLLAIEIAGDYITFRRDRVLLVFGGLAIAILALPARAAAWGAGVMAATWVAGWLVFTRIPEDVFIDTPVDQAAGGAAYFGTSYIPQQLAGGVLAAAVLAGALGYVLVARRRRSGPFAQSEEPPAPEGAVRRRRPRAELLVAGVGVGLVALTVLPDLPAFALGDPLAPYKGPGLPWDLSNLVTWNWLVNDGAVPMKDFFWPYGETWVFNTFPLGPLWQWLARSVVLALASWALWRLSPPEGRALRVVLCALALVLLGEWLVATWRYAVPLSLALVYAAVGPARHRRPTWGHAILALAALNTALWGIDTLIYGVAGMAFVLLGELFSGRVSLRPTAPLVRGLAIDGLALAAVLLVPLLWVLQGSFEGNVRWAFGLRAVSAASAAAQDQFGALREYIGFKPTTEMVAVVAPALFLTAGLAHALLGRRRGAAASALLLAAAGILFALLLKHLVRPQGEVMVAVPILPLLWLTIVVWEVRRWVLGAAVGGLVALFVWAVDRVDVLDSYWEAAKGAPARTVDAVELTGKTDQISAVDRRQFSPANLPEWEPDRSLARHLGAQLARTTDDSFAVYGDVPYVYPFFKQRPPYHVELYDASKRVEQEAMVEELEEIDPNLILWRRDYVIDGVPQAVRTPIVLRWIVERYVPVSGDDISDVLRRREPGEERDLPFWRGRLGPQLGLGHVTAASSAEDAETCTGGDGCNAYAVLEGEPEEHGQPLEMTISGRGGRFSVGVLARPGETEYPVRIDRLWFAPFLGPRPSVQTGTPGFQARLEHHRTGDDLW